VQGLPTLSNVVRMTALCVPFPFSLKELFSLYQTKKRVYVCTCMFPCVSLSKMPYNVESEISFRFGDVLDDRDDRDDDDDSDA